MFHFLKQAEKEYKTVTSLLQRMQSCQIDPGGTLVRYHTKSGPRYLTRQWVNGQLVTRRISETEACRMQEDRFRKELRRRLNVDAALLEQIQKHFLPYDAESIWAVLPSAYQPEEKDLIRTAKTSNQAGNQEARRLYTPNVKVLQGRIPEDVRDMLKAESRLHVQGGKRFNSKIVITDEQNEAAIERPTKTISGRVVRSVSEGLIESVLESLDIPYIYDRKIELKTPDNSRKYKCPDFIIVCPDGFIFIWEHLGLLDSHNYCLDVGEKLYLYGQNGIHPGYNLILTADNTQSGIDADTIFQIIETMILPHFQ